MSLRALNIEHQAILQAEQDEPGSEKPNRTSRIEEFYAGDFSTLVFQNLRFYKRRKGKRAGHLTAIYVDPKTGKGYSPVKRFLANANEKGDSLDKLLDNMKYTVDPTVIAHWKTHIKLKIMENQRRTVAQLRKEKEKLAN